MLNFPSLSPTASTKALLSRLHYVSPARLPVGEWEVFQVSHTCSHCASTFVHQDPPDNNKITIYLGRLFGTFAPIILLAAYHQPRKKRWKNRKKPKLTLNV